MPSPAFRAGLGPAPSRADVSGRPLLPSLISDSNAHGFG